MLISITRYFNIKLPSSPRLACLGIIASFLEIKNTGRHRTWDTLVQAQVQLLFFLKYSWLQTGCGTIISGTNQFIYLFLLSHVLLFSVVQGHSFEAGGCIDYSWLILLIFRKPKNKSSRSLSPKLLAWSVQIFYSVLMGNRLLNCLNFSCNSVELANEYVSSKLWCTFVCQ